MNPIDPDLSGQSSTLSGDKATPVSLFKDPGLPAGTLIVVSRWKPTEEERTLITEGGDVYVAQLTETDLVQTISVFADPGPFRTKPEAIADATGDSAEPDPANTVPTNSEGWEGGTP